jgi:hypothetical protein
MFRLSGMRFPRVLSAISRVALCSFAGAGRVRGLALLALLAAFVAIGCGGNISPFLSAQFAQNTIVANLPGRPSTPTTTPTDDDGGSSNGVLNSVCSLDAGTRTIQLSLQNEAQQPVQFAVTFIASAGDGGFVCDDELPNYLNAGYTDAIAPGQTTLQIGCDTITLQTGTRLLSLDFGINQNQRLEANTGGVGSNTIFPLTTRTGNVNIPVPELVVFGDSDTNFVCTGANLCTQRGFVYVSNTNIPVGKSVEASRIQGTLCNEGFGTAPEWRLDKTPDNGTTLAFQYVAGGTIVATVLDRSGDSLTNNRNQVVWQVTDANSQTVVHNEDRGGGG